MKPEATGYKEFIEELKSNGYKVYSPSETATYCYFVKGDKIGYLENGCGGMHFGSVHKPCSECGTGFGIHREIHSPTIEMAEDCLSLAPHWASVRDRQSVKKYKSWEDYTTYPTNTWSTYIEL